MFFIVSFFSTLGNILNNIINIIALINYISLQK